MEDFVGNIGGMEFVSATEAFKLARDAAKAGKFDDRPKRLLLKDKESIPCVICKELTTKGVCSTCRTRMKELASEDRRLIEEKWRVAVCEAWRHVVT